MTDTNPPTFNGEQLAQAQRALGLTDVQFARMLGFTTGQHIRRLIAGEKTITETVSRLVSAYISGFRPPDWPLPKTTVAAEEEPSVEERLSDTEAKLQYILDVIDGLIPGVELPPM